MEHGKPIVTSPQQIRVSLVQRRGAMPAPGRLAVTRKQLGLLDGHAAISLHPADQADQAICKMYKP